jgi:class 3 adenylate cyclase
MPVSRTVSSQSRVAPGLSSKPRAATAAERSMLLSASASVPPQRPTTILELVASEQTLPGEAALVRKPGVNFIDPSPVIGRKRQASQSSAKSSNATPRSPEIMGRSVSNSSAGGVYGGAAYGAGPSSASKLGMMVMSPGRSAVGIHSSGGYGSSGALLQAQRIVEDDDVMGIRDRLRSTGRGLALGFTIATLAAVLLTWLAGPIAVLWRSDLVPVTQLQTTSVVHHGTLRWRMAMCVEATREVAQGLLNPGVTAAALQGHLASSLMSERSVAEGLETLKANRRGAQESANIAFIRSGLARKEDTLTNAWSTSELQVERIEGSALVARNVTLLTYLSLSFSYMDELIKIASEQSLPLAPQAQTRVRLLAGALVRSFLDSGNAAIDEAGSAMAILLGAKTKEVSREIRVASWALMIAGAVVWFACALPLGLVMTKMQRDTLDTLQRIPKVDVAKARNRAAALHSEASMLEVAGPDGANLWGGGDPASQSGSEGTESLGLAHSSRSLSASAAAATSSSSKATNSWKASPGTMSLAVSLFLVVFACAVSVGVYARTAAALSAQAFASNVEIINANQLSTHSEISMLYLTEGLWTALGAANATGPVTAVGVWAPTAGRLVLAPRAQDNILECTAHYRSLLYGGVSGDQSAFTDASRTDLLKGFMGTRLHRDVARDMLAVKCTSDGLCEDTTWRMEAYIHSIVEASESLQEGGLEAAFERMEGARLWYRESLRAWARSLVDAFSRDLVSESTSQVSGTAVVSTIGLGILALLCALVFLPLVAEHHARTKASLFLLCLLPLAALKASRGSLELAGLSVSVRRQGSGSSDRGKGKKGGGGEDDDGGGGGSGDNEHGHRSRGVLGWFFKKRRPEAGGGEFGPSTRKNPKPLLDALIESLAVSEDRVLVLDDTASVVWANENLLRLTVGHSLTPLLATSVSEFVRDSRCQTLVLDFARRAKAAEVGGDVPAQPVVRLDTPLYLPGQEASYPSRIHVKPLLLAGSVFAVVSAKDIGLEIEFDNSRKDFDKARRLIQSFVPPSIAKRLEVAEEPFAERYPACVVIFIDLVNFTAIASSLTASKLASLLSVVFAKFDSICDTYYLDRIKTIGDGYMAVGGLFDDTFPLLAPETNTEMRAIWAGLEVHRALEKINSKFNTNFHARVGIHTGHVVAGVMSLTRVSFDVYGDTVNIASRCESTGTPGFVHVTSETFEAANLNAPWFSGKAQEVTFKGKSHPHTTYLIGQGDILKPLPASYVPGGQVVGDKDDTDLKFE